MAILAVDDDELSRDALAEVLRRCGYDVLTASCGGQALEILGETDCRMVISDWGMPESSGLALCRAIRQGKFGRYIYIILLTVRQSSQEMIEGLAAGADDFMTKPFHPAELRDSVRAGEVILSLNTSDFTPFALARLTQSRDPEMGHHMERVRRYAKALGEQLAGRPEFRDVIDGEYLRLLYLTTPLHDIGKMAIADSILLKPGKLTAEEYEVMKTHTLKGAHTLQSAIEKNPDAAFPRMARDIALTHHERYDGTGYPAGLAGDAIPLCGRIVAVADVYDAMTSSRVYKQAVDHETARGFIVSEAGRQFDPDVVQAFVAKEEEFIGIAKCFSEESLSFV
ncbi:MAG TPA: HD domain-containing phosphohydrolase [Pirellulales bacterium]|nr:HD domain-containing phosphohydrolase [Pirellulales bacterium]